ncbi:MAG: TIGR04282 family arsenosugar biosynthesis glycosyltransferase [Magnetococcales bacterium]|nr:TIGR04282 family arsenosugar biosynthesis glycosyltransferase [Magnetococcales bacterium]
MPSRHGAKISLNLLGKAPVPGFVKTRLIPALGAAAATRAHIILLTHLTRIASDWCAAAPENRLLRLWCAPDASDPWFRTLVATPAQLRDQPEGDLGARLAAIAASGLAEAQGVMLLGGDAASLTPADLNRAGAILRRHPAVMIPARDGGYLLLGLRANAPELFSDMPWGTERVAAVTRARLRRLGWSWEELPGHWDVDRPEDWEEFCVLHDLAQ